MSAIDKKEYKWGKHLLFGNLAGSIFSGLVGFSNFLAAGARGDKVYLVICFIFSVISFFAFLEFLIFIIKGSYIEIVKDGMRITSRFFPYGLKDVKWSDISKIEKKRKKRMTLHLLNKKKITIHLGVLKRDDQNSLSQIIEETIKHRFERPPEVEEKEIDELHPESELDDQKAAEPSLKPDVSTSPVIQRGLFRRFFPIFGICLLVVSLGIVGWLLLSNIQKSRFSTRNYDRIDDTVDGYARYRDVETGAVVADLEGTFFEALGLNKQNCPEYRHWRSDIVFVRLPGGTVAQGEGRSENAVGPYLIAKLPLIGSSLDKAFQVAMGKPFSAFLNDEGRYNYGKMSDFAKKLGVSGWSPTLPQRRFAMGSDWKPGMEKSVERTIRDAPNEYGIISLRHDPNIEPGFRLVHDLPSSTTRDTGIVPTGLEGIESTPKRKLDSVADSEKAIQIQIVEQEWSGLKAGSVVYDKEGDPLQIRYDLASLTFSISVENSSNSIQRAENTYRTTGSKFRQGRRLSSNSCPNSRSLAIFRLRGLFI